MRVEEDQVKAVVALLREWGYDISDSDEDDAIGEFDTLTRRKGFSADMPVGEAGLLLRELAEGDGCYCPVCGQRAQVYKRQIYSTMAEALITLYKAKGREWQHIATTLGTNGGDVIKLAYWGIIEQQPGQRDDGSPRTGWWRITEKGEQYLRGQVRVPKYAHVYDSELLGFSGPLVGIEEGLGKKFDYGELMAGV